MRTLVLLALLLATPALAQQPVLKLPGWSEKLLCTHPTDLLGLVSTAVDRDGNLYIAEGFGTYRYSTTGERTLWADCPGYRFSIDVASGEGYLTNFGGSLPALWDVSPSGSCGDWDTGRVVWATTSVAPDGKLYADIATGAAGGIYQVDRQTGRSVRLSYQDTDTSSTWGWWHDSMVATADGVFVTSIHFQPTLNFGIYKLTPDGQLEKVVSTEFDHWTACAGPDHMLFTGSGHGPSDSYDQLTMGEVYLDDPAGGRETLLADHFRADHGIAYDAPRGRLIVVNGTGAHEIWVLTKDSVPTRATSWGALKVAYR